jgi:hypothetical protein
MLAALGGYNPHPASEFRLPDNRKGKLAWKSNHGWCVGCAPIHFSKRLSWFRFFAAKTISNLHSPIEIPYISPHPPQTLAAQFKRPYRNCPDHTNLGIPHFCFGAVPIGIYRFSDTNLPKLVLATTTNPFGASAQG